jgi:hypothetical protein
MDEQNGPKKLDKNEDITVSKLSMTWSRKFFLFALTVMMIVDFLLVQFKITS